MIIGKYDPEQTPETIYKLCLLSANNEEISSILGISRETLNQWKNKYAEVADALKRGREFADSNVASKLYQRACGYVGKETRVFCFQGEVITKDIEVHYPPDTGAAAIWLKNRHPDKWRDHPKNTEDGKNLKRLLDALQKEAEFDDEEENENSGGESGEQISDPETS